VDLTVDAASSVPPFEQVRAQVVALVDAGDLPPGTRLPTVRGLADELGLAVNTVARAYRELEAAGVVETRGRHGTVVASGDARERAALEAAAEYVRRARALGLGRDDAVDRVGRAWDGA
jgi:DNA-binding transcriptional regulator YhcF (GntR family)